MILYWFLLLITAALSYGIGSLSTMLLASKYVFRTRLRSLGTGNVWFSNFRRIYGIGGFIKLLIVELVKDVIPILIGGLLLGFIEIMTVAFMPSLSGYRDAFAFVVLVLVLLVRPTGLFGQRSEEKI